MAANFFPLKLRLQSHIPSWRLEELPRRQDRRPAFAAKNAGAKAEIANLLALPKRLQIAPYAVRSVGGFKYGYRQKEAGRPIRQRP